MVYENVVSPPIPEIRLWSTKCFFQNNDWNYHKWFMIMPFHHLFLRSDYDQKSAFQYNDWNYNKWYMIMPFHHLFLRSYYDQQSAFQNNDWNYQKWYMIMPFHHLFLRSDYDQQSSFQYNTETTINGIWECHFITSSQDQLTINKVLFNIFTEIISV